MINYIEKYCYNCNNFNHNEGECDVSGNCMNRVSKHTAPTRFLSVKDVVPASEKRLKEDKEKKIKGRMMSDEELMSAKSARMRQYGYETTDGRVKEGTQSTKKKEGD